MKKLVEAADGVHEARDEIDYYNSIAQKSGGLFKDGDAARKILGMLSEASLADGIVKRQLERDGPSRPEPKIDQGWDAHVRAAAEKIAPEAPAIPPRPLSTREALHDLQQYGMVETDGALSWRGALHEAANRAEAYARGTARRTTPPPFGSQSSKSWVRRGRSDDAHLQEVRPAIPRGRHDAQGSSGPGPDGRGGEGSKAERGDPETQGSDPEPACAAPALRQRNDPAPPVRMLGP